MKHVTEEELVELYFGDGDSEANTHVQTCRECWSRLADLQASLEQVKPAPALRRGTDYGEKVWQALRPQLVPYAKKTTWTQWKAAALFAACAVLLLAAFVGGRLFERTVPHKEDTFSKTQVTERVLMVVLSDHLERTERMLVALAHADPSDRKELSTLQDEASELLASNRLFRATASQDSDPALARALDQLERVLAEISNDPHLTAGDLDRVRQDMNTDAILFELRVLLTRETGNRKDAQRTKGTLTL